MQVEGERTKAQVPAKEIGSLFQTGLLLGSRVQVVNTATTNWASKSKGRRALKEGMMTQIVLNEKLLSLDLEDTNVKVLAERNDVDYFSDIKHVDAFQQFLPNYLDKDFQ